MSAIRFPPLDVHQLYTCFEVPVTALDCGKMCAPHNASGKPFCCDICHAVPTAYRQEWDYLRERTSLWHEWRGDECLAEPADPAGLRAETPAHMLLLACQGPQSCQRNFRALSCRQFPFFPYISSDDRFLGLAYEWAFERECWLISNLGLVSRAYRNAFVRAYEAIFALWEEEFDSYARLSEEMRAHFAAQRRRIPLLHRNGACYQLSPSSERLRRVSPEVLPGFGPYRRSA